MNRISDFYKRLFWGFYRGQVKMLSPTPEFAAAGILAGSLYLTLFDLAKLYELASHSRIIPTGLSPIIFGAVPFLVLILNYYFLVLNGKFEKTRAICENASKGQQRFWTTLSHVLFGASVIVFFLLLYVQKRWQ